MFTRTKQGTKQDALVTHEKGRVAQILYTQQTQNYSVIIFKTEENAC